MPGDDEALLKRFRPQLMYDSLEAYFADHPAQMVVNPGNELRRADGSVLARVVDGTLTLAALGPAGAKDDVLAVKGKDYAEQYKRLRLDHPDLKNVMVARARRDRHGWLWLQYWLWYFYNDYRLTANIGLHEGDWEMVQLRLGEDDVPDYAVYAQHARAQRRPWNEVEKDAGRPDAAMVYVARGSHASYFEDGIHPTEVWADVCDGGRRAPEPQLVILPSDDAPKDWSGWPGRWGDTKATFPGGSGSPDGPCRKKQWKDPARLSEKAYEERTGKGALLGALFDVGRRDGKLLISYNLVRPGAKAVAIAVNVNSSDEPGVPPRTASFEVTANRATVVAPVEVHPQRTYDVRLSMEIKQRDGTVLPSIVVQRILDPGDHAPERKITTALGTLLVPVGEWVKRLFRKRRS
ncbi:hypothetical protein [Baekduia sp. Peel2402]|uniref:hypothetical protein n=1 Tax=Baekduia sp. Peel2402 TaxID=3458296 RepID=UPI00403EC2AB